jgi:hypothetical protein
MAPDKPSTGYPPVTQAEERDATQTASRASGRSSVPSGRLGANEKIVTDAIAAVIERYRAEIKVAPLDDESRWRTLDLLDAVFLDILHAVLNEPTARAVRPESRIQH